MTNEQTAEALKLEGNTLWAAKKYIDAAGKYTQALSLVPNDAKCLGNRAACFIRLDKLEEALADINLAVKNADAEYRPKAVQRKMDILRSTHRYYELLRLYECEERIDTDETRIKKYKQDRKKLETLLSNQICENSTRIDDAPFNRIRQIMRTKADYPKPGSADWKILYASQEWSQLLALVQKLKQGFNPPPIPQLQDVSNNILGEPRAFYITSQMDLQKIQFMMMSEQQARGAIGPDLKPHNVIEKYSKMLKEKGWNVVRPALSVSVRGMIVIAHVHTITGNFVEAYQTLKKALKILELADEKWPKTENPERGASLEHTFIRKVKSTLIQYIGYTVRESSNPDVEYMKELCDQVLVCCKTRPVDLKDSGWHFWMCYHQYCIAEAHMGLAHYHKIKGMKNKHESELGYHEYDSEHLKQAIVHYQFAVNWYPEDEHYRCVAAWSMLDCMIFKGGHTLNQLIEYQQVALEQDARLFPVWGYYAKRSEFANEQIEVLKKRFDQSGLSYDLVVPKMKEIITEDVDEARRVLADLQERNSANEFQDEITFFSVLAKTKKDKEDVGADIDL